MKLRNQNTRGLKLTNYSVQKITSTGLPAQTTITLVDQKDPNLKSTFCPDCLAFFNAISRLQPVAPGRNGWELISPTIELWLDPIGGPLIRHKCKVCIRWLVVYHIVLPFKDFLKDTHDTHGFGTVTFDCTRNLLMVVSQEPS